MLRQFFQTSQRIGKLVKLSSTSVGFNTDLFLKLGGLGATIPTPVLSTAVVGIGGMESAVAANTLYYVYAIKSGLSYGLIASTSVQKPSAFNLYKKVGAFYTNNISEVVASFYHMSDLATETIYYTPTYNANMGTTSFNRGSWRIKGDAGEFVMNIIVSAAGAGGAIETYLPSNLRLQRTKVPNDGNGTNGNSGSEGSGVWYDNGSTTLRSLGVTDASDTSVSFARATADTSGFLFGSQLGLGHRVNINFKVPLAGLSESLDWLDY